MPDKEKRKLSVWKSPDSPISRPTLRKSNAPGASPYYIEPSGGAASSPFLLLRRTPVCQSAPFTRLQSPDLPANPPDRPYSQIARCAAGSDSRGHSPAGAAVPDPTKPNLASCLAMRPQPAAVCKRGQRYLGRDAGDFAALIGRVPRFVPAFWGTSLLTMGCD
jgi:hypothetical protein